MQSTYDIAIVGGRCAGCAAAIGLARAGYRVLLLERQPMPSDTLSTHVLWPDGVAALARLGVLDQVLASGAPPARHFRLWRGEESIRTRIVPLGAADYLLCPRRIVLDGILWEAARSTPGVDAYDRTTMTQLRWEDGRVIAVDLDGPHGRRAVRVSLAVGADGRGSTVARDAGAEEHDVVPPGRYWYFAYFANATPPDPEAPELAESDSERDTVATMPTNDGLQMVIYGAYDEDFHEFRRDHRAHYLARVRAHPGIARLLASASLASPVYGFAGVRGYYRDAWGPGWALVGDAAHQKDPLVARGVNEALLAAEWLTDALRDGIHDDALARYATTLRERTWSRALNAKMLMRPDRYMTAEQGATLARELATPAGLAEFLRVEYDDALRFEDYFATRVAS